MIYLIVFLGLVLRFISLNQSLWLDEATTALVARMSLTDIFVKFLPGDFHPPLYYLILKFWGLIFGTSEIALRVPSVIFGLATIYLVYLIGLKIKNKDLGLIAAAFTATSGLLVYYSQEARMYSLVAMVVSLLMYAYLQKRWLAFSIVLTVLGMTDYVALFIIPVFYIFNYKEWKKLTICLIPLILSYVLWMPIFVKQMVGGLSVNTTSPLWWKILGETSLKNFILIPTKFIIGRITIENKIVYGVVIGAVGSLFIRLMTLGQLSKNACIKFIWLWVTIPIFLVVIVAVKIPILSYFRLIYLLPAVYLLVGYGVCTLKRQYVGAVGVFIVLLNTTTSLTYLTNTRFQREDWRNLSETIGKATLVLPADSQKEALIYYGKGSQAVFYRNFEGGEEEVWLSRYIWQLFDPEDEARRKLENLGYNKVLEADFNGIVLYKYAHRY